MKKINIKLVAMLVITSAYQAINTSTFAQAPQKISYQAVIRNSSDQLVTSHAVGMKISILQTSASGTAVYIETQTPSTNANGLVTIEIGGGTIVTGTFAAINWANGPYFIKTETDPTGGTSYTITGTSQLLSVPYALHAKTSENITGDITETDPIFGAWNKSTGINITASQVSDFQTNVTNNTAVLTNTAKNSYPSADATKLAGIAAGAEVNVNADWNATSGDAQILNKPTTHYVGELYGGGIVITVWKEAGIEKGLIASLTDISSGAAWSNVESTEIGATAQSPFDGQANTNAIITQLGHTSSAAKLCDDYTNTNTGTGVYSDWYLPAYWELNQCYNAAIVVNTILGAINGFQFTYYWSSSEYNGSNARTQHFSAGVAGTFLKLSTNRVRAVRRF